MSSKKKINETLEIAKKNACENAFNKYVQGMEESKRMIFESIEDQIYKNLNEYMVCSTVVEEDLDKKNKEHKIEANLVLAGSDNDAKADLLKSGPLECKNIFVINSKDDYELLKNKLMEQYE